MKLNHRIALQAASRTSQGGGVSTASWATVKELYGNVKPLSARERYAQGQEGGLVTHEVKIRKPVVVSGSEVRPATTGHRLLFESRVLWIKGVQEVEERGYFYLLQCAEEA